MIEPMRKRDKAAFAVFSVWMTAGLFLDGWSHNAHKPETFFTPYHGLLYSGFAAAVLWGIRESQRSQQPQPPAGGGLALVGAVLFGIGGIGDFVWHSLFGIEKNVAALLSPTHLTLMTGGLLAASTPLRAAKATRHRHPADRTFGDFFTVVLSLAVVTALVAFFLQFASGFRLEELPARSTELARMYAVVAILVTNALLLGAAFYLLRWWTPPTGTFTFLFGIVALAQSGLDGFRGWPLVVAALIGGAAADALWATKHRNRWLFGAVVPAALWGSWLVVFAAGWGLHWDPEFSGGVLFFAVLTGLGLAALTAEDDAALLVPQGLEDLDLGGAQGGQGGGGDHDDRRQGAGRQH